MNRLAPLALVLAVSLALFAGAGAQATPSTTVVVSQLSGGGGNIGAPYANDFVELHNVGSTAVDLSGWSVQYAPATGTSWAVTGLPAGASVPAGGYYLVQEAAGQESAAALPTPDASGTTHMNNATGKVALVSSEIALEGQCPADAGIVDFVGYGPSATCYEGTASAPAPSRTTAIFRGGSGCLDTDENSADFSPAAPAPRNTASMLQFCVTDEAPTIVATTPSAGGTDVSLDSAITVEFDEPVDVTGAWYAISCLRSGAHTASVTGGGTTFTLDPDANLASGESCEVTISASHVSDQDLNDPPDESTTDYTFGFTVVAATQYVVISSDYRPVAGETVTISAQLADASGGSLAEPGRTVHWSTTRGTLSSESSETNAAGSAIVELTTSAQAGLTHTVTGIDGDEGSLTGTTAEIISVNGPPDHLTFTSAPAELVSGAAAELRVELRDVNENAVTSDSSTEIAFSLVSGSGTVEGLDVATAAGGAAALTVTGKAAGTVTIAAEGADLVRATTSFVVVPSAADHLRFTSVTTDLASGSRRLLTVEIRDANENVITSDNSTSVTLTATAGPGTVTGLRAATAVAGKVSIGVAGRAAGSVTIDADASPLAGDTTGFSVVPGPPHHLAFTSPNAPLAHGASRLLAVEVRDGSDNLVTGDSGRTVTFAQAAGAGTVAGLDTALTASGRATETVTGTGGGRITIGAAAGALRTGVTTFVVLAPDGSGTMTAATSRVANASSRNTIAFTYRVASGGVSSGQFALTVPDGWSAPSMAGTNPGYVIASAGTLSVSERTITVSGLTLGAGARVQLVYGSTAAAGPGATAPPAGGDQDWVAASRASDEGTLTNLTDSPSIAVLAPDGSGTMTTETTAVSAGATGHSITFTYTAAVGGIYKGVIALVVPIGWSAPSMTGTAPGFVTASTGTVSVSVSGRTVVVAGLTHGGGETVQIVYGSTSSGGPGAAAPVTTGTQSWQTRSKASAGGTLQSLASSPSIAIAP
jgi:Bacterial Ig-like domain/Lamin Tail Domain